MHSGCVGSVLLQMGTTAIPAAHRPVQAAFLPGTLHPSLLQDCPPTRHHCWQFGFRILILTEL